MADRLKSAAGILADKLQRFAASPIVYQAGNDTIGFDATSGTERFEADTSEGFRVMVKVRDFLFPPGLLDFGDGVIRPQRGHRIIKDGTIYEVLPITERGQVAELDQNEEIIRVHTKAIGPSP